MVESAPRTARAIARAELTARILSAARRQLAEVGASALSLRAIARELGMASSAIYRYFASRDELLTALLVQLYNEVGDVLEEADGEVGDRTDLGARFTAMATAMRTWAVGHRHDWALLYGSPVPGYAAPADTVVPAGRASGAFVPILAEMAAQERQPRSSAPALDHAAATSVSTMLDTLAAAGDVSIDADLMQRGMLAWTAVLGSISLELFGHLHQVASDYPAYFGQVVARQVHDLGLDSP